MKTTTEIIGGIACDVRRSCSGNISVIAPDGEVVARVWRGNKPHGNEFSITRGFCAAVRGVIIRGKNGGKAE